MHKFAKDFSFWTPGITIEFEAGSVHRLTHAQLEAATQADALVKEKTDGDGNPKGSKTDNTVNLKG